MTRTFKDLVARSGFIFVGTVRAPAGASRVSLSASTSERSVLVDVEDVLKAPAAVGNLVRTTVRVVCSRTRRTKVGDRVAFFATSRSYGATLIVSELGRLKPQRDLRRRVEEARAVLDDDALGTRIRESSLIVTGWVTAVRPWKGQRPIMSEHDPLWWEATIDIGSVDKGTFTERQVQILYPSSTDEAWRDSPKCYEGQAGTWILRNNQQERGAPAFRVAGLTSLDTLDYQPPERNEHVTRLLYRKT